MRENKVVASNMRNYLGELVEAYSSLMAADQYFAAYTSEHFNDFEHHSQKIINAVDNSDVNYDDEDITHFRSSYSELMSAIRRYFALYPQGQAFSSQDWNTFDNGVAMLYKMATQGSLDRQLRIIRREYELNKSIPDEVLAPVQVVISDGRVKASTYKKRQGQISDASLEDAKTAAHTLLSGALIQLAGNSNSDPRLLEVCGYLKDSISPNIQNVSIITVGVYWQTVVETLEVTRDTVPDAALPQLDRVISAIRTILSQYEDWGVYASTEAATHLTAQEIKNLASEVIEVSQEVERAPEVFDKEIPERLSAMSRIVAQGIAKSESIAPALIGSIDNLFGSISHVVVDYTLSLGHHLAVSDVITMQNAAGTLALLSISIKLLSKFIPYLMKYKPFRWLSTVNDEINTSISNFFELMNIFK